MSHPYSGLNYSLTNFYPTYHLRGIGYQNNFPYTNFSNFCWNIDCPMPGVDVEFLRLTLQSMNSTISVIQNSAFTSDALNMIANGTADISLMLLRQTQSRMNKVYFSIPVGYLFYGYLLKEIPTLQVQDYLVDAFEIDVLVLLGIFTLIVGTLIFFYTRLFKIHVQSIFEWIFRVSRGLLNQSIVYLSGPVAAMILFAIWIFGCMIILIYYQAKLKSFLTYSHRVGTIFDTLDGVIEAVKNGGYTMVIQEEGFTPYLYCKPYQCLELDALKHKTMTISITDSLEKTLSVGNRVGFIALSVDVSPDPITYFSPEYDVLFVRDVQVSPDLVSYAFNKKIPKLRESLNRAVAASMDGYSNIRARYTPQFRTYDKYQVDQEFDVLRLAHFVALFRLCGYFAIVAVVFLILEKIINHYESEIRSYLFGFRKKLWVRRLMKQLHIQYQTTKRKRKRIFHRAHTIILPAKRSYSPPLSQHKKFYTV